MPIPLLEVSHLQKRFGKAVVVNDLSFSVTAGEIFGLLGPNGAGKSTTMQMIVGLLEPDGGTITLEGMPLCGRDTERFREIGFVPQDLAIYPEMSAEENLQFFGDLFGIPRVPLRSRIAEVMDWIGLSRSSHQRCGSFSGGMKRRLNFGIGILHQPKILILDEPTVGVDPQSRAHLLDCVRELAATGVGVVYASHYLEEVEALCSRLSIVDHGKILLTGTMDELCHSGPRRIELSVTRGSEQLQRRLPTEARCHRSLIDNVLKIDMPIDLTDTTRNGTEDRLLEKVSELISLVRDSGAELREIHTPQPSLEQLFLSLTGRTLRDG
ncbi:MAG: ABC transporter ATP-binding protein [Planctomycetota bacterium]|nr:ABC transporter ATP-binding protein [Planctomycetota bacterium]MDA1212378.1 ABC transporter ATP-binding protein [Planctomycetota bacterium]